MVINEDDLRRLYIEERLSFSKIAKIYHCGDSTIRQNLIRFGIPIRSWSEALKGRPCSDNCKIALSKSKRRLFYDKVFFEEKYRKLGLSTSEIGEMIGCNRKTVTYWLKRYEIPLKTREEATLRGAQNPAFGRQRSEEIKRKISEANTGKRIGHKHTEQTRQKIALTKKGPLNPNWRNGARQEKYCFKFNFSLKESIREQFGRRCLLCGANENGRKLDIHHTDFNKMQGCNRSWSLVPLCNRCHGRIERNIGWYWFGLMYNHWLLKSEWNIMVLCNYPLPHFDPNSVF